MLNENKIIDILELYFKNQKYKIISKCTTNAKGIDLIIKKENQILAIEAKGETSSKTTSNRFGKPFTTNQIKNHIGKAILKSYETKYSNDNYQIGIALPKTNKHFEIIDKIFPFLKKNNITIYFVNKKKNIEILK